MKVGSLVKLKITENTYFDWATPLNEQRGFWLLNIDYIESLSENKTKLKSKWTQEMSTDYHNYNNKYTNKYTVKDFRHSDVCAVLGVRDNLYILVMNPRKEIGYIHIDNIIEI